MKKAIYQPLVLEVDFNENDDVITASDGNTVITDWDGFGD